MQQWSNSIASALELLPFCTQPSMCTCTSYTTITGHTNYALLQPATQSSNFSSSSGANNAVDGDISSVAATAIGDFNPWWKVQLAFPVWVTQVEIINSVYKGENTQYDYKETIFSEFSKRLPNLIPRPSMRMSIHRRCC